MPIIRVEMFKGRSVEQKRELVKALTQSFVSTCGGQPQGLQVIITDVDMDDWGSGGELCSDKFKNG